MSSHKLGLWLASGLAMVSVATGVRAAVLNVDTPVDDPALIACGDATPNDCSLRGAIIKANGLSEPVTINLPAGTYVLSQATPCFFGGGNTVSFWTTPALCPVGTLTLVGAGADATVIDANQTPGVFVVAPVMLVATTATVTVRGVTMRHGNFGTGSTVGHGGGINNAGTLTLVDTIVSENWSAGAGGGIFNQGDLTLLRTVVSRNVSRQGGGGIWNTNLFGTCNTSPCHDGQGIATIADSTISDNVAPSGGGIFNFVGMIDISGSTISDNESAGGGGGIYNAAWNINLTNVTVSGNRGRVGGGILNQGPSYSTMRLNNVTIANNTAQDPNDPTFGLAGGLYNGGSAVGTLANTIIAGNFAAGLCGLNGCFPPGNDCLTDAPHGGALTSQGYNLVQDTQGCDIIGNTTGNITGLDPKLGFLTDNGGHTFTLALAAGSSAIDAGSPASAGSGGNACAITDQRALIRPIGSRCDIGAFERSGAFAINNVIPSSGGNTGQVSLEIGGGGFLPGASVKLHRADQSDIVANRVQVDIGGASIAASFDLAGRTTGVWDVVVTNPDSTSQTLASAFSVHPGTGPALWVDIVGLVGRPGRPGILMVIYGNRGDTDAFGVPLSVSFPSGYQAGRYFDITPPPAQPGEVRPDWGFVSESVALPGQNGFLQVPLFLPIVPSGFSGVLRTRLVLPSNSSDTIMVAAIGDPMLAGASASTFVTNATTGAQSYLQQIFGIIIPAALVPQMQQYATTQLQQVISDGQAAFAASLGTQSHVYSLAQLQLDLAFFAAARVGSATP